MKTVKEIVAWIAKQEGKTKEVSVGNIREIVGIVSELVVEDADALMAIIKNGQRRLGKK